MSSDAADALGSEGGQSHERPDTNHKATDLSHTPHTPVGDRGAGPANPEEVTSATHTQHYLRGQRERGRHSSVIPHFLSHSPRVPVHPSRVGPITKSVFRVSHSIPCLCQATQDTGLPMGGFPQPLGAWDPPANPERS